MAFLQILCVYLLVASIQAANIPFRNGFPRLLDVEAAKECFIKYVDFPDKEPVLVNNGKSGFSLIPPHDDGLQLNSQEEIYLSCPGTKNTLAKYGEDIIAAKCSANDKFIVNGKPVSFSDLTCEKAVSGEVQETTDSCGASRGVIKHIGGEVSKGQWLTLFDVCYDDNRGEALYAAHTLYGSAITYGRKDTVRPGFKTAGLANGVSANNAYKQATEKTTFASLLGSAALADEYINSKSFLARGHLSPDADFVYVTSQYSSYFYINTVPQWQAINNGNWKSLEFSVRSLAASTKKDYRVITGSHETLTLPNSKGKATEMYLSNNMLAVPKFVWKIMYDLETSNAIAFVSLNNPFVDSVTKDAILCKDICSNYGWGTNAWQNTAKGLIYCCEVKDLAKVVKTIPALNVRGVLAAK